MRLTVYMGMAFMLACSACRAGGNGGAETAVEPLAETPAFDADSAYSFVERMVAFGPRVPNTEAHTNAGDWLVEKLGAYTHDVIEQKATLRAFDGTFLNSRNIFARINPEAKERILLLSHWDCRPWADQDPDAGKRNMPVDGANDGASGVGVLLEIARQLSLNTTDRGIDILFVDAEDWGSEGDEESWALGTRYFAQNPPVAGYKPKGAILLDMVGSPDATFGYEYFSNQAAPTMLEQVWANARYLGHDKYFHQGFGGAVTDDHVELIKAGIPAIDIIDYRHTPEYQGFDPVWHTTADNMSNISKETLSAVGETILFYIR